MLDAVSALVRIFHFLCNVLGFDPAGQLRAQHTPPAETLVGAEPAVPFPPKVSFIWKFSIPFPGMGVALTAQSLPPT